MTRTTRLPAALAAMLLATTAALQAAGQDAAAPVPPMPPPTGLQDLGLTQNAWADPQANQAPGQSRPGYRAYRYSWASTYKITLRTGAPTSLRMDPTEQIRHVINGNPHVFETAIMAPNLLVVRPLYAGVDTVLQVPTFSGRLYSFYVRSYPPTFSDITDHIVDVILDPGAPLHLNPHGPHTQHGSDRAASLGHALPALNPVLHPTPAPGAPSTAAAAGNPAFAHVETAAFDPAAIRWGDFRVRANTTAAAAAIGPTHVFRTDTHTYIDFGDKARSMQQWPTVMLLDSATEAIVNTQTIGRARQMLVVDAIGSMVLAAGQHIICIDLIAPSVPAPAATDPAVLAAARFPTDAPPPVNNPAPPGTTPSTTVPELPAGTGVSIEPPATVAAAPPGEPAELTPQPTSETPAITTPAEPAPPPDTPPAPPAAATPAPDPAAAPSPTPAVLTITAPATDAARTRAVAEALLAELLDPPFPPLVASPDGNGLAVSPLSYPVAVRLCARLNAKSFSCRVTRQDPTP